MQHNGNQDLRTQPNPWDRMDLVFTLAALAVTVLAGLIILADQYLW